MNQGNTTIDRETSYALAERLDIHPKQCWRNAALTASAMPNVTYVEGWVVDTANQAMMPIEHGWVEREDGTILDPTLYFWPARSRPHYFAGVRYTAKEIRAQLADKNELPFVWKGNGWGGLRHPAYNKARRDCLEYSEFMEGFEEIGDASSL
jgi:hypothetical protein